MSAENDKQSSGGIPAGEAMVLADLVDYGDGAVVSRTLAKNEAGTFTLFAFDQGQQLSEHSAPFDAYVQVVEGEVMLTIDGQKVPAKAGQIVLMPADIPHAVDATTRFKMLLVMLKEQRG